MADNEQQAGGATGTQSQVEFAIQRIYVKDLSFESPNAPQIFVDDWSPDINLQLQTSAEHLGTGEYEVTLTVTAEAKQGERTAFLVEVQKGGVFTINGLPEEQMGHMLGAFCPNILFPYAREVVCDLATRGGFPQLLLAPVNFDAIYARHQAEQAEQAEQAGDTASA